MKLTGWLGVQLSRWQLSLLLVVVVSHLSAILLSMNGGDLKTWWGGGSKETNIEKPSREEKNCNGIIGRVCISACLCVFICVCTGVEGGGRDRSEKPNSSFELSSGKLGALAVHTTRTAWSCLYQMCYEPRPSAPHPHPHARRTRGRITSGLTAPLRLGGGKGGPVPPRPS